MEGGEGRGEEADEGVLRLCVPEALRAELERGGKEGSGGRREQELEVVRVRGLGRVRGG